jgi:hypothetical protein
MKNMDDSRFDDELKNRLGGYTEEPDDALWQGIAAGISSTPTGAGWLGWVSKGMITSFAVVSLFIAGDSRFKVQGSRLENWTREEEDALVREDSKFKVQGSKIGANDLEVYDEGVRASASGMVHPDSVSETCDEDLVNVGGAGLKAQSAKLKAESSGLSAEATQHSGSTGDVSIVAAQDSMSNSNGSGVVNHRTEEGRGSGVRTDSKTQAHDPADTPVVVDAVKREENVVREREKQPVVAVESGDEPVVTDGIPEDIGVVNYAGPARPSRGNAAVAAKPLKAIDSVQVVKISEEKVKDPKEEQRKEDKPRRESGPLSIYFTAMPTLGYQKLEANPSDNVIVESFEKLSNFSSKRLGVRAEIGAEYALTPRVKAFGGLLYYQRKQTISYTERVSTGFKEYMSGDTLTLDPQFALEDRSFEYELRNLGVQLGVNYVLRKKTFLHVAGTGIEFHKALNKLPEAQKELGFTSQPSTYVFYNLYYRVQYPAEGRLKAIFQPTFNYSLFLNRDMHAPFYVKPYGLGLNLGVTYSF